MAEQALQIARSVRFSTMLIAAGVALIALSGGGPVAVLAAQPEGEVAPTGLQCYCKYCQGKKSRSACFLCCTNNCGSSATACQDNCENRPNCGGGGGGGDDDGLRPIPIDGLPDGGDEFLHDFAQLLEEAQPVTFLQVLQAEEIALRSDDDNFRRVALMAIGESLAFGLAPEDTREYIVDVVEAWLTLGDLPMRRVAAFLVAEYETPVNTDRVAEAVVGLLQDEHGQRSALRILARLAPQR